MCSIILTKEDNKSMNKRSRVQCFDDVTTGFRIIKQTQYDFKSKIKNAQHLRSDLILLGQDLMNILSAIVSKRPIKSFHTFHTVTKILEIH